jgi:hypothetical protein
LTRIVCVKKRRRIRVRFELTMIIAAIKKKGRVQFKLTMISEANKEERYSSNLQLFLRQIKNKGTV